ncbi:MAG: RHS repeat-associated core domain-containing protein [Deltaproteobacteria bacterium]
MSANIPDTGVQGQGFTRYVYDGMGNVLTKALPNGTATTYTYDGLGRLLTSVQGTNSAFQLTYDSAACCLDSGCGPLTNTVGRLALRQDSFGNTYYSYDAEGRVLQEIRVRSGSTACSPQVGGVNPDTSPTTTYSYTANGQLAAIGYPHGRTVSYVYPPSGAGVDRVTSVGVQTWNGTSWVPNTVLSNVTWEPYGGLRAYQMAFQGGETGAVEYLLGASGTKPGATCPATSTLGVNDATGRLRAVLVSSGALNLGGGLGDILRLIYSWTADQVLTRDVCALGSGTPQRETFDPLDFQHDIGKPGYDRLLRFEHAEMPYRAQTGGAYAARDIGCDVNGSCTNGPGWDNRGNPAELVSLDLNGNMTGTAGMAAYYAHGSPYDWDLIQNWAAYNSSSAINYSFGYDLNGRTTNKGWATDSSGSPAHSLAMTYGLGSGNSGLESLSSVTVQNGGGSSAYNYYYDAFQRRRLKAYPTAGVTDEYFYDLGHQLLEDRGSYSSSSSSPYPEDDYVWLGGRPVAYVRGQFTTTRTNELASPPPTCSRQGDNLPCGTYFVVTDHIGKPVIALNPSSQIAGLYDYDVFGGMNRQPIQGDTGHPYAPSSGTSACSTNTYVIANVTQPPAASGMSIDTRERFHYVDDGDTCGFICNPFCHYLCTYHAQTQLRNGDTSACLATLVGPHQGAYITSWFSGVDHLGTAFYSDSTSNTTYDGASVEAVDYREYQTGATPLALPLRFPGQYYDPETDLHENWNRFYDPSLGTYLDVEPMLTLPTSLGRVSPPAMVQPTLFAYSYAQENPVSRSDEDGLYGTKCCSYYASRCGEAGGGYYCSVSQSVCKNTPSPTSPDNWPDCVRKCLQDWDQLVPPGGTPACGGSSPPSNQELAAAHAFCWLQCENNPSNNPFTDQPQADDPPGCL